MAYYNNQKLLGVGRDAFPNLFDLEILAPSAMADTAGLLEQLNIRLEGFKIPETNEELYDVVYKTGKVSLPKPTTMYEDQTLEVEFRVDSNYAVYDYLLAWKNKINNAQTGEFHHAGETVRTTARLRSWATDQQDGLDQVGISVDRAAHRIWQFYNLWCFKLGTPEFSREPGDPIKVSATFVFSHYDVITPTGVVSGR